eukprot:11586056-Alexandrium_andersonii.AAC.1
MVLTHADARADPLAPFAGWGNPPRHHGVVGSELHGSARPGSDALIDAAPESYYGVSLGCGLAEFGNCLHLRISASGAGNRISNVWVVARDVSK